MSAAKTQLAIAEAELERAQAAVRVAEMKIQHLKAPTKSKSNGEMRRVGLRLVDASTYDEGGRQTGCGSPNFGSQTSDRCESSAAPSPATSFTKKILSSLKLRKPAVKSPEEKPLSVMNIIGCEERTANLELPDGEVRSHRIRRRSSFDENMTPVSFQQMPVRAQRHSKDRPSIDSVFNGGDTKAPDRGLSAQDPLQSRVNELFNLDSKASAPRGRLPGDGRRLSAQDQLDQLGRAKALASESPPPPCAVQ